MKNIKFLFVLTFLLSFFALQAQDYKQTASTFGKGRIDAQIGVGLTPTFIGDKGTLTSIPLSLSVDLMLNDRFSVGVYGSHSVTESQKETFLKRKQSAEAAHGNFENGIPNGGIEGQWENTYTESGVRFGIHVISVENFDFYGGINLGIRHSQVVSMLPGMERLNELKGITPENTSFAYGGFVGARYAVSNRFVVFGEAGTGASFLKVGVGFGLCSAKAVVAEQDRAEARALRAAKK